MGNLAFKLNRLTRKRSDAHQIISYAIIGIASNLVGYLAYLLLTFFLVEPKIAMTLVYLTGASVGYFGNRKWTFTHKGKMLPALMKYSLAHAFGYTINFIILYVFVDRMVYPHQAVQFVAILVVAGILFFLFKKLVFPQVASTTKSDQIRATE
jgi:putative flippase GtrA